MSARKKSKFKLFPIVILFISTMMAIGYAAVNSISLSYAGEATAKAVSGVFITQTNYKSNNNADSTNSRIVNAYQTTLNSKIILSESDINSTLTYSITIYNSKPYPMAYDGTTYILGEDTYSNESIGFSIDGMTLGEVIQPNQDKTFTITFSYQNTTITDNKLNSIINFKFVAVPTIIGEYDYTGKIETLNIPYSGVFKLEVWGGQGGNANKSTGGYGSYSVGEIVLNANQQLSIVVAGKGEDCADYKQCSTGGYNGGGSACGNYDTYFAAGGGATHIATASGLLSSLSNSKSAVLIVAGGGGGAGYIGNSELKNKHMTCYSCSTSTAESTKTISVTNVSSSPLVDYAKEGNGYAKITFIAEV